MNARNKFLVFLAIVFFISLSQSVFASNIDDLQKKISDNNAQITQIQKEIEELKQQLNKIGSDKDSLNKQISQMRITIKKLQADINLTERKITQANLAIDDLNLDIQSKQDEIDGNKRALAEFIRNMDELESKSLIEILLANDRLSDFFGDIEKIKNLQNSINANLEQTKALKNDLQNQEIEKEIEKRKLENLHSNLTDQETLVETQKNQKNSLLKETKNRESEYKKLLAERQAKQQALENEINAIEEQIRIEIDPNSLPKTGSGVLFWPIDPPIAITQYFGNTPFATQNPQVYGGKGHNGIDLRAAVGTPIKSARAGVITATGDTDIYCNGVSYGNWILIRHDNNLSTLYAHLSLIRVSPGENVETGQIIGYSGYSGYVTGPHLHFTVFATPAVEIGTIRSRICGTTMKLPIAPYNGYLNPLSYL